MRLYTILLLTVFMLSPTLVMAGFDDIEEDIQMMEEALPEKKEAPREMREAPQRIIQQPTQRIVTKKAYDPGPTKPVKSDAGIGFKVGSGSGTWENRIDGATVGTGDFDISTQMLAFYFIDGGLELDIGTGSFTYPSGGSRDFTELTLQGNIGRGIAVDDSGISPYFSLGMSYYFVDYSDTYDYYGNSNPVSFEWYGLLGGGVSLRHEEFEFFAEYILSVALLSTGRSSSTDSYDTIETFHDNSRFVLGIAVYF